MQAVSSVAQPVLPIREGWDVDGKHFASTRELVDQYQPPLSGSDASYTFQTGPAAPHQPAWKVASGATTGAAIGAGIGLAGCAALDALGLVGAVMTAGMMGMPSGIAVLAPTLVCAGIGAAIGIGSAISANRQKDDGSQGLGGTLTRQLGQDGKPHLILQRSSSDGVGQGPTVDLTDFAANAKPAQAPQAPAAQPAWRDALKGAGMGLGAVASSFVPIGMLFIAPGKGHHFGAQLDHGGARGKLLGTLAGVGIVGATYASLAAGWPALVGLAGAAAVTGAIAGPKVLPRLRAAEAQDNVFSGQWYDQN